MQASKEHVLRIAAAKIWKPNDEKFNQIIILDVGEAFDVAALK